jgi:polysaccharide biosynthesis/export protein
LIGAIRIFVLLLSLVLLSACASRGLTQGYDGTARAVTTVDPSTASLALPDDTANIASQNQRLSELDLVDIQVFGVEELSGEYQIDNFGKLKFPLIGSVDARGLTANELSVVLEKALSASYLEDPTIIVRVLERLGQQITVEGDVSKPGLYKIESDITLLKSIALAGGLRETAQPRRVVIFRTIDGERHAAGFDLVTIRRGDAADPVVYGNDIVVIEGSTLNKTYREVLRTVPLVGLFIRGY